MCNKLVIGIPTYNRQDKCYRLLEEIAKLVAENSQLEFTAELKEFLGVKY